MIYGTGRHFAHIDCASALWPNALESNAPPANWFLGRIPTIKCFFAAVIIRPAMRTLLQHKGTGLYFYGPEKWTSELDLACDFHFVERAQEFVRVWELENVEVVFSFDDTQVFLVVPLGSAELKAAA